MLPLSSVPPPFLLAPVFVAFVGLEWSLNGSRNGPWNGIQSYRRRGYYGSNRMRGWLLSIVYRMRESLAGYGFVFQIQIGILHRVSASFLIGILLLSIDL